MNRDDLLKILACPKCHGPLEMTNVNDKEGFKCEKCALVYPIRSSIPVMLINEAIPLEKWQNMEHDKCES